MKKPKQYQRDSFAVAPPVAELAKPRELKLRIMNGLAEDASAIQSVEWETPRQELRGKLNNRRDKDGYIYATLHPPRNMREGTVLFRLSVPEDEKPVGGISLHPANVVAEVETLIDRLELNAPQRICFAGDSLTALNPQANYLAVLARILRSKYDDGLEIINSGVGGDTIERIENRLDETVISRRPDWVFILTCANDSKIAWRAETRGFGECFVPPDRFAAGYRRVIERLREAGVGRISVISGTASYEPTCRKVHEEKMARGETHNFFGRPDLIEQYNAMMKSLAEEYALDYIDVYTPMKASAEWRAFTDDSGVHLAEPGERFLAVELLRFLAGGANN